jgi:hypothetical protein
MRERTILDNDDESQRSGGRYTVFCDTCFYRRASFLVSRLLAKMGLVVATPILDRFSTPVASAQPKRR